MTLRKLRERYWSDLAVELSAVEFQGKKLSAKQIVKCSKIMGQHFQLFKNLVLKKPKPQPFDWTRYMGPELDDVPELEWKPNVAHYLHDNFPQYGQEILNIAAGQVVPYEKIKQMLDVMGKNLMYLLGDFPPKKIREYK